MGEAVATEDMVHYDIVLVGVDPDAGCTGECPVQEDFSSLVTGLNCCYAVNYIIGLIIEPAAFDMGVSRVRAGNECHCGYDAAIFA